MEWEAGDSGGGRRPGDAPGGARLGAGGNVRPSGAVLGARAGMHACTLARLHAPPGARLGGRLRAPERWPRGLGGPEPKEGGGGEAPVTSGSRGSGRGWAGLGGGEAAADWRARTIHTTQWSASSRPARGSPPSGLGGRRWLQPRWGRPPWLLHSGSSRWSCGRRRVAAAARRKGREGR